MLAQIGQYPSTQPLSAAILRNAGASLVDIAAMQPQQGRA